MSVPLFAAKPRVRQQFDASAGQGIGETQSTTEGAHFSGRSSVE